MARVGHVAGFREDSLAHAGAAASESWSVNANTHGIGMARPVPVSTPGQGHGQQKRRMSTATPTRFHSEDLMDAMAMDLNDQGILPYKEEPTLLQYRLCTAVRCWVRRFCFCWLLRSRLRACLVREIFGFGIFVFI